MVVDWPTQRWQREPLSDAELTAIFDQAPDQSELVFQIYGEGFKLQPFYAHRLRFAYLHRRPILLGNRLALISTWALVPTGDRSVNLAFTPHWLSDADARALGWRP